MQPSMLDPSDRTLTLTFRTEPVEWMAPKHTTSKSGKPIVYSPQIYKDYKEALQMALRHAWKGAPDINEFWIELEFRCGSEGKKKPRDYDNLAKTVGDAGNKIVWKDDSQITFCRGILVVRGSREPCTIVQAGLR